jgi:predicted ATPase
MAASLKNRPGGPSVVCLEDLHWADPSTLELVHFVTSEIRQTVLDLNQA